MENRYYLVDVTKGAQGLKLVSSWNLDEGLYCCTNFLRSSIFFAEEVNAIKAQKQLNSIAEPGHFFKILYVLV